MNEFEPGTHYGIQINEAAARTTMNRPAVKNELLIRCPALSEQQADALAYQMTGLGDTLRTFEGVYGGTQFERSFYDAVREFNVPAESVPAEADAPALYRWVTEETQARMRARGGLRRTAVEALADERRAQVARAAAASESVPQPIHESVYFTGDFYATELTIGGVTLRRVRAESMTITHLVGELDEEDEAGE